MKNSLGDSESLTLGGRVFKSGNSLAILIPSAIAKQCAFDDGIEIEITVDGNALHLRKTPAVHVTGLIDRITDENRHESSFDEPVGVEV